MPKPVVELDSGSRTARRTVHIRRVSCVPAFGECRQLPLTDGTHGLEVVRVLEAIDRSSQAAGRPVEIER